MRPRFPLELGESWCEVTRRVADRVLGPTPRPLWELVAIVSDAYNRQREALLDRTPTSTDGLHARLRFYLPRDAMKILPPLGELARADRLPKRRWRVLDVGAGLGSTSLGAARMAAALGVPGLDVLAIDRDARALDVFSALAAEHAALGVAPMTVRTAELDVRRLVPPAQSSTRVSAAKGADLARRPPRIGSGLSNACAANDLHADHPRQPGSNFGPGVPEALRREGPFDLILCGLVLNELAQPLESAAPKSSALEARRRVLDALFPLLADDGALIVLEPALRDITRDLHRLRDGLAGSPWTVFAPCLRSGPCPMLETERDWCHEDIPFALPPSLATVARDAGLRFERLTYAYLTLRRDGHTLAGALGEPLRRVVSMPLVSKGKRELFVCDDEGRALVRRLDRDARPENADFGDARRGDILRIDDGGTRVRAAVTRID